MKYISDEESLALMVDEIRLHLERTGSRPRYIETLQRAAGYLRGGPANPGGFFRTVKGDWCYGVVEAHIEDPRADGAKRLSVRFKDPDDWKTRSVTISNYRLGGELHVGVGAICWRFKVGEEVQLRKSSAGDMTWWEVRAPE